MYNFDNMFNIQHNYLLLHYGVILYLLWAIDDLWVSSCAFISPSDKIGAVSVTQVTVKTHGSLLYLLINN